MGERNSHRIWKWLVRLLRRLLVLDAGPVDLSGEVANRLFDPLTPDERMGIRRRFGVDPGTNAALEELISPDMRRTNRVPSRRALIGQLMRAGQIRVSSMAEYAADRPVIRQRIRDIESSALIRLHRWEYRKLRLPGVQQRLMKRIAAAHDEILENLSDAPPVRPVLVGWHDQLVDGRRGANEIAVPPDPVTTEGPQDPETILAEKLRKALWANARARKPVRATDCEPATRKEEREKALSTLRDLRLNARSILAVAESLLGPARRIEVEGDEMIPQLLAPVIDPDAPSPPDMPPDPPPRFRDEIPGFSEVDPALADAITAEAGMPIAELWARASRVDRAVTSALHNQRLLIDSCMPVVAETAIAKGLRGIGFFDGIEKGEEAVRDLANRFCFPAGGDFTAQAEQAIRAALESGDAADFE